jgi:hypothetical protein
MPGASRFGRKGGHHEDRLGRHQTTAT